MAATALIPLSADSARGSIDSSSCGSSAHPRIVVIVNLSSNTVNCTFPDIPEALAAVSDGHGGWFIAGYIGRYGVVHMLADGRMDSRWRAPLDSEGAGTYNCIDLIGGSVFVGGPYRVEALSASTGALLWAIRVVGSVQGVPTGVVALTGDARAVFISGAFTTIDNQRENHIAVLNPNNGHVLSWRPSSFEQPSSFPADSLKINTLALYGDRLFIGGNFSGVDGKPRNTIAALNATTGSLLAWTVHLRSGGQPFETMFTPTSLFAAGGKVFVGEGENDYPVGGIVDSRTGILLGYWPSVLSWASWFAVRKGIVYIGGNTTSGSSDANGDKVNDLGAYALSEHRAISWKPPISATESGEDLVVSGVQILLLGVFS